MAAGGVPQVEAEELSEDVLIDPEVQAALIRRFAMSMTEEERQVQADAAARAAAMASASLMPGSSASQALAEQQRLQAASDAARSAGEAAARNAAAKDEEEKILKQARYAELADAIGIAQQEGSDTVGRQIADYAAMWIDKIHYGWGRDEFYEGGYVDCSHFTFHVLAEYVSLSYYDTSYGQREWGNEVAVSDILPGDLVCYEGHVAIYYGGGLVIHAPRTGHNIEYGYLDMKPIITIRRLW